MNLRVFGLLLISLSFTSGCGNYHEIKIPISNSPAEAVEKVEIDFSDIKTSFLNERCFSCHSLFQNYSEVVAWLPAIEKAVLSDRMPKFGPPLGDDQKSLLVDWIAAEAPEFAGPKK